MLIRSLSLSLIFLTVATQFSPLYTYILNQAIEKYRLRTFKVNFLSTFFYRVYDIEERIKTPRKFRFPQFEPVNWLAALKLKNDLSDLNSDSTLCPSHLLSGIKALLQALKLWLPDLETKVFSKLLLFIGIVYSDTLN